MVRKEKVKVEKKKPTTTDSQESNKVDVASIIQDLRKGLENNRQTFLWFVLIIIAVIQLRQFIVGLVFLTFWILLVAWFFDTTKDK